jgi:hypothetical protein
VLKYKVTGMTYDEYAVDIFSRIERHPEKLIPVFDDTEIDIMFYVDDHILACEAYDKKNYGWLTESAAIVPWIYEKFANMYEDVIDNYNYVFSHSRELVNMHEKIKWIPASATWIRKPKIYTKTRKLSMVTSAKNFCKGHSSRLKFLSENKDKLDLYGNGFHNIEFKEDGLKRYMFSVAYENAYYPGYFTEKILDCFATGTIPIYRGDPEIGKVFNTDGIIFIDDDLDLDSLNEELYESKMEAIKENLDITINNFMRVENYIYDNYLEGLDGNFIQ